MGADHGAGQEYAETQGSPEVVWRGGGPQSPSEQPHILAFSTWLDSFHLGAFPSSYRQRCGWGGGRHSLTSLRGKQDLDTRPTQTENQETSSKHQLNSFWKKGRS